MRIDTDIYSWNFRLAAPSHLQAANLNQPHIWILQRKKSWSWSIIRHKNCCSLIIPRYSE